MISIAFFQSCDNADLPVHQVRDDQITTRTDDCEDCAFADCCCVIEYVSGSGVTLQICGTADGFDACSGGTVGSCDIDSGGRKDIMISSGDPRHFFCMDHGQAFWLVNTSSTLTITVEITCQYDELNPQSVMITLDPMERVYYGVDGECEVAECG